MTYSRGIRWITSRAGLGMRAHYLQHVPFEGLGSIALWLDAMGCTTTSTRLFESVQWPTLDAVDFLIVMGGPMSVNDEGTFPWLSGEKAFIRRCIDAGKPVLGICLGAQLIASALDADVHANDSEEIGWFPIQAVPVDDEVAFRLPASIEVFHWHGETFELPAGAVRLARSEACENQAFQLGPSVIGLQFHLETTPASAREIVAHCRSALRPAPFVQSESDILVTPAERYRAINDLMDDVLAFLVRGERRRSGASS